MPEGSRAEGAKRRFGQSKQHIASARDIGSLRWTFVGPATRGPSTPRQDLWFQRCGFATTHRSIDNSRKQTPHETEAFAEHPVVSGRRANQRGSDTFYRWSAIARKRTPEIQNQAPGRTAAPPTDAGRPPKHYSNRPGHIHHHRSRKRHQHFTWRCSQNSVTHYKRCHATVNTQASSARVGLCNRVGVQPSGNGSSLGLVSTVAEHAAGNARVTTPPPGHLWRFVAVIWWKVEPR